MNIMHAHKPFSSGYTLIETVMVLIIVAILAFAVYPRFFSTITYNRQVYYDEVLNSLRYARKLAIGSGSYIQVSLTSNSLTLQRRIPGSSCTVGTTFQAISDPANRSGSYVRTAPTSISLNFTANWPIYFDGLGRAMRASDCTVISSATVSVFGGNTVTLIGETGFVQ